MGAIETRAVFVHGGDLYLVPLPRTGGIPDLLAEQIDKVVAGKVKSTSIYLPQDLATDLDEDPDPELAIAEGFEITRQQKASLEDGTVVTWQERLFIIRSKTLARVQARNLDERLSKAEAELLALTPPPGRGKRRFDDPVALQQAVDAILARYKVTGLLEIEAERQVTMRHVRKYQDRPARTEKKVRYLVQVHRRQEAIDQAKQRLGWRVYATNASAERLTLTTAVLAYRDQYLIERSFSRLKGTVLAMLPLYVQRDDHAIGLIRLLTIALRAMVILEFDVRRSLAEEDDTLSGLYDGNPKRSTARPTAELILKAFDDITLAICFNPVGEIVDKSLTLLNKLQTQILNLLGLSSHIYERLTGIPVKWPVSHSKASSTTIPVG
jgi:transposase